MLAQVFVGNFKPTLTFTNVCGTHARFVTANADGNADSPGLLVHEIPVDMPTFED
jgi:hypothetical protein